MFQKQAPSLNTNFGLQLTRNIMKQNCACFEKLLRAFHHHAEMNPPPLLPQITLKIFSWVAWKVARMAGIFPDYLGNF